MQIFILTCGKAKNKQPIGYLIKVKQVFKFFVQ